MTSSVVIKLEDINNSEHGELYVGTRKRLASCTGVRFLDRRRLLATSLVGKRMYLIGYDLDAGTHQVEACIPTQYAGQDVTTDLLDFDGYESIVTSNCDLDSVSLYRLAGERISHVQDLPLKDDEAEFCHGVKFVPGDNNTVCATCIKGDRGVYFVSTVTGDVLYKFSDGEWIPRDACFLTGDRIVVVYSRGHPGSTPDAPELRESKASLVALDLAAGSHELLSDAIFPDCQAESCVHHAGTIYFSNQLRDTVAMCEVDGDTISPTNEISGFDFPHGVDLLPELNLLAVTNYGDNSIVLTRV
jgi:hypothetical protein